MKAKQTVSFLLLVALPTAFLPPVQRTVSDLRIKLHESLEPVWSSVQFVTGNTLGGMNHAVEFLTVYRDHQLLKEEVQILRHELTALREIQKENERLSELLELKKAHPDGSLIGHIITRRISHWFRWVVIDIGKRDGVSARMVLVNDQGVVGRIVKVGDTVSESILITDPESRVGGMVQSSRSVGVVTGEGSRDRLHMNLIPRDSEIRVGDQIVTSGLGGIYPKGYPIGTVTSVGMDRDGMHLSAQLRPAVEFNALEEVLCIASYPRA